MIGGQRECTLAAAGYLVRDGVAGCTAVLIEPDLVLTAGHCVEGHHEVAFGLGEVGKQMPVRSIALAIHPRYIHPPINGGVAFEGHDVALLRLEHAVDTAPAPLGVASPTARVRAVGYGATSYVADDAGGPLEPHGVGTERRSIEGAVRGESATELFVRFDTGSSACYGDSGGPLFTEDGTLVGILSRFTERGRCLPKDRSLMGYIRVDAMADFFRDAHACLDRPDVQACLREDERGLCAVPRFETHDPPIALDVSDPDRRGGSKTIALAAHEQRTIDVTPSSDVELTVDSPGDARMRVVVSGSTEPIATQATRVRLEGKKTYTVVIGSCNANDQSVVVRWSVPGGPENVGTRRMATAT